jgi:hypothetical protein
MISHCSPATDRSLSPMKSGGDTVGVLTEMINMTDFCSDIYRVDEVLA